MNVNPLSGDYPFIRTVSSPLTSHMLRPLDPRCETVQFSEALSPGDYVTLSEWMAQYPSVTLRAFGSYDGSIRDLDFLRHFPGLQRFSADAMYSSLQSLEGLGYLPASTTVLGIGQTKKKLSLKPLERFTALRRLSLEGQTKDIGVISALTNLRSLTLRSITLPDLSILQTLGRLRALDLKLGGTRDLTLLPTIGHLEYLELWMVRGLHDLSPISGLEGLSYLFLESLKQVEKLPDFTRSARLETVWLQNMKGLKDLAPLLAAPALRRLALVEMAHLQAEDVGILAGHPVLEAFRLGLGSERKNNAARSLVALPPGENWGKPDVFGGD
ncbi:hypothetical protein [Arthrobacter sp. NPDC090010]|uniref:hypothetical protein n=1 Tax=Arthrobacter sp. NPDC090010 TaxID=3363942 RepID=UPI00382BC77E